VILRGVGAAGAAGGAEIAKRVTARQEAMGRAEPRS
jgi:hypothetical protein